MLGGHVVPDGTTTTTTNTPSPPALPLLVPAAPSPSPLPHSPSTARHLRKLFWLCYMFDKEISLRTGQPPCIGDEYCDLTLPDGYLDVQYQDEYLRTNLSHLDESLSTPLLPSDLRLSMLKSKACRLLYSAESLKKSDADLLRDIRELGEELEAWRQSVPEKHRPSLSLGTEKGVGAWIWRGQAEPPKSVRMVAVHLGYHYLLATIHQAIGRCRAWKLSGAREMESVRSSLTLAVEASRSTLLFLRTEMGGLLEEAFW